MQCIIMRSLNHFNLEISMKMLATAVMTILMSSPAFAGDLYGKLLAAPAVVKVITEDGTKAEYAITPILDTAHVSSDSLSISQGGMMAMCGDYLGQLAEDFSITVDTKGVTNTVTVRAASGNERKVSVFGTCQGNTNILEQLQIDVKTGAPFEIK